MFSEKSDPKQIQTKIRLFSSSPLNQISSPHKIHWHCTSFAFSSSSLVLSVLVLDFLWSTAGLLFSKAWAWACCEISCWKLTPKQLMNQWTNVWKKELLKICGLLIGPRSGTGNCQGQKWFPVPLMSCKKWLIANKNNNIQWIQTKIGSLLTLQSQGQWNPKHARDKKSKSSVVSHYKQENMPFRFVGTWGILVTEPKKDQGHWTF